MPLLHTIYLKFLKHQDIICSCHSFWLLIWNIITNCTININQIIFNIHQVIQEILTLHQLSFLLIYSSFQFNLSAAGNCQGAPLFSTFVNIIFSSVGAADCSITKYLLISIIMDKGSNSIGQASVQALQLVHAHNSSAVI